MAKILIVDDDVQLVGMLKQYLNTKGHDVIAAGDPAKGMQLARQEKPDLVILDYHMPGDTGAHLFEAFRRNRAFESVPVLFMSGSKPEHELLQEIASRGRTAYLRKGVALEELAKTIEGLLSSS
jgi:DNA-binding response OmpR family regulator